MLDSSHRPWFCFAVLLFSLSLLLSLSLEVLQCSDGGCNGRDENDLGVDHGDDIVVALLVTVMSLLRMMVLVVVAAAVVMEMGLVVAVEEMFIVFTRW